MANVGGNTPSPQSKRVRAVNSFNCRIALQGRCCPSPRLADGGLRPREVKAHARATGECHSQDEL